VFSVHFLKFYIAVGCFAVLRNKDGQTNLTKSVFKHILTGGRYEQ